MAHVLTVQPLSREAFAAFGEVLDTEGAELRMINDGTTERFHALAHAELDPHGTAIVSLFRGQPRSFPYRVTMMERHPLGSQAFFPIDNRPWLVIAAADDHGTPGRPQVFLAQSRQGVNYRANVWHHPLMTLEEPSDFLVVDRDGEGSNLEEFSYPEPFVIEGMDWSK